MMAVPGLAVDRESLISLLSEADGPADVAGDWPEELWSIVVDAGLTCLALPVEMGGVGLDRVETLSWYRTIAEGSLTAAFILTQHDASVRRLVSSGPTPVARDWLEKIARGEAFTTVGISQLTTSRRHGSSAVVAREESDGSGYRIDGVVPWVTASERASVIVAGASIEGSNDQILFALPMDTPGVNLAPAFRLAALGASRTTEVVCKNVRIRKDEIIAGPTPDVVASSSKPGGTGGLETSALALGQSLSAIRSLEAETSRREDLIDACRALREEYHELWSNLEACAREESTATPATKVRGEANDLVARATQAYLTARKGSGFLLEDSAQRWARQALFFLVWSCPAPVAAAHIQGLAGICPDA